MARAEIEQRALRREFLLARAAMERAALAEQLDILELRSRSGLPGALLRGASRVRRSGLLGVAATGLRLARSQPWLLHNKRRQRAVMPVRPMASKFMSPCVLPAIPLELPVRPNPVQMPSSSAWMPKGWMDWCPAPSTA